MNDVPLHAELIATYVSQQPTIKEIRIHPDGFDMLHPRDGTIIRIKQDGKIYDFSFPEVPQDIKREINIL